ncbi:MAG: 2-phospho-L-lactate guanylyltransferase [Pseudaminobacter sp.]|nr:2-phospho-L-lactate guanylyltransferase [Pseudaminobacter sp.]
MIGFRHGIWALVPVKRLDRAKTRLAAILDAAERRALARAMLLGVFGTLSRVRELAGILVVTSDVEAASIARLFGAAVIPDPVEDGTRNAVGRGMRRLDEARAAGVIVVPGDVPFVTVAELTTVLVAMRSSRVVVVPATRDGGTNILGVSPPAFMPPAYGPDSFTRHVAAARSIGVEPEILSLDGAGHDIDVAADLVLDQGEGPASRTRACLGRFAGIGFPVPAGLYKEALLP